MPSDEGAPERIAENLERQRALYGAPLGERIGRLTTALEITQGRLARTLGLLLEPDAVSGARRLFRAACGAA